MLCQLDIPVVIVNFVSDTFCGGSEYAVWNHYLVTAKEQEGTELLQRRPNVTILFEEGTHSDGAAMFSNLQLHARASRDLFLAWQGYWTELLPGGTLVSPCHVCLFLMSDSNDIPGPSSLLVLRSCPNQLSRGLRARYDPNLPSRDCYVLYPAQCHRCPSVPTIQQSDRAFQQSSVCQWHPVSSCFPLASLPEAPMYALAAAHGPPFHLLRLAEQVVS